MISHEFADADLSGLQMDTHIAMSLFERDFPLSLQNLTTHLIHHIADGLRENGPLYGRWLFPYERANGWITRQTLQKVNQEATIMETYVIYDWCVYMYISQKLSPSAADNGSIKQAADYIRQALTEKNKGDPAGITGQKNQTNLGPENVKDMESFYINQFDITGSYVPTTAYKCNFLKTMKNSKLVKYNADDRSGRKKCGSVVAVNAGDKVVIGHIRYILEHHFLSNKFYWFGVELMDSTKLINGHHFAAALPSSHALVHVSKVSEPLVSSVFNGHLKVLNSFNF